MNQMDGIEVDENEVWHGIFEKIENLLCVDLSISTGMVSIIEACEPYFPHDDWEKLRLLDYENTAGIEGWLRELFQRDPLPPETRGLWFGLFNPFNDHHELTADLYVVGSPVFWEDDMCCQWACDPHYVPVGRYARSTVLDAVYRIGYDREGGLRDRVEYPLCLAYGALTVKHFFSHAEPHQILGEAEEVGVAVGFDEGDCLVLGNLTHDGFIVPRQET